MSKSPEGITFEQFLAYFCQNYQPSPPPDALIHVFHSLDRQHTGFISQTLLTQVLRVGQTPLSEDDISFFFESILPICGTDKDALDYTRASYEMLGKPPK
eukprot:Protomagalhaensia_sp_Gyna_25__1237@NODE_1617_length_1686_cov_18_745598_g1323_i0_p2_GENE_NODE_1617_length_1686_cov_18_745598_g1323_i0NODE_1617_length_1686_cov_18_745598_g1323_i0_p2_ORF_typecomplete_len100_score12_82EFhand_7/PF13499_6/2_6e03EFhand_7/PF13499_6/3_4e05EFhand_11/PF08976_11/7_3e02EFhand_11/PF08976_11/0_14EFhand_6/PF13405_6/4_3e03EFhand_6/PF13405_6/0_33_NODE_1617_length_1686_cov_18_745598_g1323_i0280579